MPCDLILGSRVSQKSDDVGDLVDDDAFVKRTPSEIDMFFQKDQVVEDRVLIAACHHDQRGIELPGDGNGVEMDGGAIGDVFSAFDEEQLLSFPGAGQKFSELFSRGLLHPA